MQIEILYFDPMQKNALQGYVDFKVIHSEEKWEIFRKVGYFEKEEKKWLNISNVQRDEKWIPTYERNVSLSPIMKEAQIALELYFKNIDEGASF